MFGIFFNGRVFKGGCFDFQLMVGGFPMHLQWNLDGFPIDFQWMFNGRWNDFQSICNGCSMDCGRIFGCFSTASGGIVNWFSRVVQWGLPGFSIVKPFDYFLFENTYPFLNKI